jgi:hypothetical protein
MNVMEQDLDEFQRFVRARFPNESDEWSLAHRLRRACSVGRRLCTTSEQLWRTRPRRAFGLLIWSANDTWDRLPACQDTLVSIA